MTAKWPPTVPSGSGHERMASALSTTSDARAWVCRSSAVRRQAARTPDGGDHRQQDNAAATVNVAVVTVRISVYGRVRYGSRDGGGRSSRPLPVHVRGTVVIVICFSFLASRSVACYVYELVLSGDTRRITARVHGTSGAKRLLSSCRAGSVLVWRHALACRATDVRGCRRFDVRAERTDKCINAIWRTAREVHRRRRRRARNSIRRIRVPVRAFFNTICLFYVSMFKIV